MISVTLCSCKLSKILSNQLLSLMTRIMHSNKSRVENGRGGFRFSVAMAILSNCRLSPTYHDSVSHLRSSNRTCGFPASGFPTDFTLKLTTAGTYYWIPRVDTLCLLRLRLKVELLLKIPDVLWCLQALRQSPLLLSFRSISEARGLPSITFPRLLRYYSPLRLPPVPAPEVLW